MKDNKIVENAVEVFPSLKKIQSEAIGKIKVGCIVEGSNYKTKDVALFLGCNFHLSDSFADLHAEQMAITTALLKQYYPTILYVTSIGKNEDVFLCGQCRQFITEVNKRCLIVIFNPDSTVKRFGRLNTMFPLSKKVGKKNKKWLKECGR